MDDTFCSITLKCPVAERHLGVFMMRILFTLSGGIIFSDYYHLPLFAHYNILFVMYCKCVLEGRRLDGELIE